MARLKEPWVVVVQDESIFVYETLLRKVWAPKGSKPVILTTGSHQRTVWYGAIASDGTQLFRQFKTANAECFLQYLDLLQAKYPFMVLFIDRAPWHKKDKRVKEYFHKHRKNIRIHWFPKAAPELNPMEECWRQGKNNCLGSTFHKNFHEFKRTSSSYYRTRRFKLNLYKYLCH